MKFEEAIKLLNRGNCILFTGSGFSLGAKSMRKNSNGKYDDFRLAHEITLNLARLAGIEDEQNLNFSDVAQYCKEELPIEQLIDFLKAEFTFSSIGEAHKIIGSIRWRRIYTTNYDEIIEEAQSKAGISRVPVSIHTSPKDIDIRKVCVHLNGMISRLTEKSLDSEFKLTKRSYDNDDLLYSPWLSQFKTDLLSADAVFFIGFSGSYDLDLTRVFEKTKELSGKTFFIVHEKTGLFEQRNLSRFGEVHKIGTNGFAEMYKQIGRFAPPTDVDDSLGTLRCFSEPETGDLTTNVKAADFLLLIARGQLKNPIFANSVREPELFRYFIYRDKIDEIIQASNMGTKRFLVLSDLGNGKSLFLKALAVRMSQEGYSPFIFERNREFIFDEVSTISRHAKNPVIIVDSYNDYVNVVRKIESYLSDKAILVLADRTARYETSFSQLGDFNNIAERFDLDILSTREMEGIIEMFDQYGLWDDLSAYNHKAKLDYIWRRCRSRLSTFLLSRFDSSHIKESYKSVIDAIAKKKEYYQALMFVMCCNYFGFNIEYGLMIESIGGNVLNNAAFRNNPDVKEFIDFDREQIKFSSALLSKYILSKCIDKNDFEDYLIKLFKGLDLKSAGNRDIKRILRNLVQYRLLFQLFENNAQIFNFYEAISKCDYCLERPLFWLQNAIARTANNDFELADHNFKSAYAYAYEQSFDTFQIDNHHAHFLLKATINGYKIESCTPYEIFVQAHKKLSQRRKGDEHYYYIYKVASDYLPFWEKFRDSFTLTQIASFKNACLDIISMAEQYLKLKKASEINMVETTRKNLEFIVNN